MHFFSFRKDTHSFQKDNFNKAKNCCFSVIEGIKSIILCHFISDDPVKMMIRKYGMYFHQGREINSGQLFLHLK